MHQTLKKIPDNPLFILNIPFLFSIKVYQVLFSFDHGLPGKIFPGVRICRHFPSCSSYSYEAVDKFGIFKGGFLGMKRVIACGPWTQANKYDPVPNV